MIKYKDNVYHKQLIKCCDPLRDTRRRLFLWAAAYKKNELYSVKKSAIIFN